MRPLVIGVDARELVGSRTGVGRYLGELLVRWTARPDASSRHFILYAPAPLEMPLPPTVDTRVMPGVPGTWWEQTTMAGAIRRDSPDAFFAPGYTAPLSLPCPLAVTIHDVSFSRHPEWFRPRERWRRQWLTRHAARRAAVVLTVSQFSASEICALYGVAADRVKVISEGVPTRTAPPAGVRDPIVLFVGSLFNRRNLPDLIAAFARTSRVVPDATLAIVGADRTWPAQPLASIAQEHGVGDRVRLMSYVSEQELADLYGRASVFAFLSAYEGFGLTPLEALSAGVPVVAADTRVAREVLGAAAEFVPLHDVAATAQALTTLLTDPVRRQERLREAAMVVRRYSWDTAADATLAQIEGIARR